MTTADIERDLREKVSKSVSLHQEGIDRFRVLSPFVLDDGDHLSIVLRRENGGWVLSDEGSTFMHLTYSISENAFQRGTRQKIISDALSSFHVSDRDGELTIPVKDGQYGHALYSFIQAMLKVNDVTYLTRERVRSTFMEDFRAFMTETVPEERRTFDWHHPEHDPREIYPVDCHVNGMRRPLHVFALPSDDKTRDATISLLQFER